MELGLRYYCTCTHGCNIPDDINHPLINYLYLLSEQITKTEYPILSAAILKKIFLYAYSEQISQDRSFENITMKEIFNIVNSDLDLLNDQRKDHLSFSVMAL